MAAASQVTFVIQVFYDLADRVKTANKHAPFP
jgi:hypothetical protein